MHDTGPETGTAGPGPPVIDIRRWRDRLGLDYQFDQAGLRIFGECGYYSIIRIMSIWMVTYFHEDEGEHIPLVSQGFREIDDAIEKVREIEGQFLFHLIVQKRSREPS